MFKKPAVLKAATPLRSSARRAFISQLQSLYPALATASAEIIQQVVPTGLKQCGATTSSGQKAVLYTDESGKPLWFEVGHDAGSALQQSQQLHKEGGHSNHGSKKGSKPPPRLSEVLPTIYCLWIMPWLIPRLPTWPPVVEALLRGSSLMTPGLIPPPNTFPKELQEYEVRISEPSSSKEMEGEEEHPIVVKSQHDAPQKSSLVSITPYPSSVPLAVARLEIDMVDLCRRRAASEKGKAATTIHHYGDQLWELGGKGSPPEEKGFSGSTPVEKGLESNESTILERSLDEASLRDTIDEKLSKQTLDKKLDAEVVDAILYLSLLTSLAPLAKKQASLLPLPLSALYSTYILPNRAAHWPPRDRKGQRAASISPSLLHLSSDCNDEITVDPEASDIRHSTFKKLTKWIKVAEKNDLIKTKETKGKDTTVVSINSSHKDFTLLSPYYTLETAYKSLLENNHYEDKGQPPNLGKLRVAVERFWQPTSSAVRLFQNMGLSTSSPHSKPVIKAALMNYIEELKLVDPNNQAMIRIADPHLTHSLFPKVPLDKIPALMRRNDILNQLLSSTCQEYHRTSRLLPKNAERVLQMNGKGGELEIDLEDSEESLGKITRGAAQSVVVEIRTRQGRKNVSLVTGLEVYGIEAEAFSQDLMRVVGASGSVSNLPGSTHKHPKYEVFIQGDQRKTILFLLESQHGLDKSFVQVHDMMKK